MIVIHGATGHVGAELLSQLAQKAVDVRAISRRPQQPSGARIHWVCADAERGEGLDAAFQGAERAFVMSAEDINPNRPPVQVPRLVEAAQRAGVKRIVLMSVWSGGEGDDVIAEFWRQVEGSVTGSGLEWTLLRPGRFMSNALQWLPMLTRGDDVHMPFAHRKIASIDPRDIAAVACAALTDDRHIGKTYQLTGPEALTAAEEVEILARLLRRPLRVHELPLEAMRAAMTRNGFDPRVVDAILARTRSEDGSVPVPTLQQVLGTAGGTFLQWAERHLASFQRVDAK
ncbi:MAG TPA: NAD(P)H-binding protein [Polyangiales bacterium]|nr:NAD(P)H-binding protein [Polyangiales bacterium]